jgi:hypothetical protein
MRKKLKPNATSVIAALKPAQREMLEGWLFDKNVSYKDTVALCMKRFRVKVNRDSLHNFYHKRAVERNMERIARRQREATKVVKLFEKGQSQSFQAVLGMIGQFAFETVSDTDEGKPMNYRRLREILKILIAARRDDREDMRFLLEREKWEIDVARLCAQHHFDLQAIVADDSLDEGDRLQAIRRRLFGDKPPEFQCPAEKPVEPQMKADG